MVNVKEDMYGGADRANAMVGHTLHFRYWSSVRGQLAVLSKRGRNNPIYCPYCCATLGIDGPAQRDLCVEREKPRLNEPTLLCNQFGHSRTMDTVVVKSRAAGLFLKVSGR